jgi:hypothetical protein
MTFKSILKPDTSTMVGLAAVGTVFAIYQLNVGSVAQATASDANQPILANSRKKAGYTSLIAVAGLFLVTRDANVAILGSGSIIAMELAYRHGIMADPQTVKMQNPNPQAAYSPAENVYSFAQQGETA